MTDENATLRALAKDNAAFAVVELRDGLVRPAFHIVGDGVTGQQLATMIGALESLKHEMLNRLAEGMPGRVG